MKKIFQLALVIGLTGCGSFDGGLKGLNKPDSEGGSTGGLACKSASLCEFANRLFAKLSEANLTGIKENDGTVHAGLSDGSVLSIDRLDRTGTSHDDSIFSNFSETSGEPVTGGHDSSCLREAIEARRDQTIMYVGWLFTYETFYIGYGKGKFTSYDTAKGYCIVSQ